MLAARTGRKKVDQSADVAGGWIERGGGVSAHSSLLQGSEELLQIIEILYRGGGTVVSQLTTSPIRDGTLHTLAKRMR